MKIFKGLFILGVMVAAGSCFDPPEYPNVPQIEFDRVEFYDGNSTDSLVIYISFIDGDGDLGIDGQALEHVSFPFNNQIFYQTDGAGNLNPLNTIAVVTADQLRDTLHILDVPDPSMGKLVFPRTRKQPLYGFLPEPDDCNNYEFLRSLELLVEEPDTAILDEHVKIVDTLYRSNEQGPPTPLYQIQDTLYYTINPNHYNIDVDFLVYEPGNPEADEEGFVEFDWREEFCTQSFDGRFPILADKPGALEGTLRYGMYSLGFTNIFSIKLMKLRVKIRDRLLNESNTVQTGAFTLDEIRVN